jgi:hypothetical protein
MSRMFISKLIAFFVGAQLAVPLERANTQVCPSGKYLRFFKKNIWDAIWNMFFLVPQLLLGNGNFLPKLCLGTSRLS